MSARDILETIVVYIIVLPFSVILIENGHWLVIAWLVASGGFLLHVWLTSP